MTFEEANSRVRANVRAARLARGLTQQQLGDRFSEIHGKGWSPATAKQMISNIERGEHVVTAAEIVALGEALSLPAAWFVVDPAKLDAADLAIVLKMLSTDEGSES